MFRNFANSLTTTTGAAGTAGDKKTLSPTLRPDIYNLIDSTKAWAASGQAGDGVSYGALLGGIQKYLPETKKPAFELTALGAEGEVAVLVGGVTNLILELSRWEGMAAGMAMRTWADALVDMGRAGGGVKGEKGKEGALKRGISRGLNQYTDVALLTKDFTTRIQIISCLKTVSARMYGAGTDEARKSEAMWSSKFI